MLNDATELLGSSRQKSRHVCEGDDWNLEGIAEANEAGSLHTSVDVKASSKDLWLVGDYSHRLAFNLNKACNHVFGEVRHNLVEVVAVSDSFDHSQHVVGFVGVLRDDVVQHLG